MAVFRNVTAYTTVNYLLYWLLIILHDITLKRLYCVKCDCVPLHYLLLVLVYDVNIALSNPYILKQCSEITVIIPIISNHEHDLQGL